MYLDCDTSPPIKSRYVPTKTVAGAVRNAIRKMTDKGVAEGQIGIYENHVGAGFKGYVIKYANGEPYFEPAEAEG